MVSLPLVAGSLCPGMNDVTENIVKRLTDYGVPDGQILGAKYGFCGFTDDGMRPVPLNIKSVDGIHLKGRAGGVCQMSKPCAYEGTCCGELCVCIFCDLTSWLCVHTAWCNITAPNRLKQAAAVG